MKAGFIGLGSLGGGIARRIARSGFDLAVYDISLEAMAAFDEPGVLRCEDPLDVACHSQILCVCVRMDQDLIDLAADGTLFAALGEGGLFVVHSTVDPALCISLAQVARTHGVSLIDAGVSGGSPAALEGKLSIYVGGEDAAIERARALLEACGTLARMGGTGRGMQGKLLNNLVSIANYGMSSAILDLGETLCFDRMELREALMGGSAQSFALRAVPGLLRPEAAGGLRQLLGKDLDHARLLAPASNTAMAALTHAAESMLARLERAAGMDKAGLTPAQVAERYFVCMRARDLDSLCALFAEDAVMILPDGKELTGRDAIRGMYAYLFQAGAPVPDAVATVASGTMAAVEIEARLPDGSVRRTANFFHCGDAGTIKRLGVYRRDS